LLHELQNSSLAGQAQSLSLDSIATVQLLRSLPVGSREREDLVHAFSIALRAVWITLVPFVAVGFAAGLYTEELNLDRVLFTEHGVESKKREGRDELSSVEVKDAAVRAP